MKKCTALASGPDPAGQLLAEATSLMHQRVLTAAQPGPAALGRDFNHGLVDLLVSLLGADVHEQLAAAALVALNRVCSSSSSGAVPMPRLQRLVAQTPAVGQALQRPGLCRAVHRMDAETLPGIIRALTLANARKAAECSAEFVRALLPAVLAIAEMATDSGNSAAVPTSVSAFDLQTAARALGMVEMQPHPELLRADRDVLVEAAVRLASSTMAVRERMQEQGYQLDTGDDAKPEVWLCTTGLHEISQV